MRFTQEECLIITLALNDALKAEARSPGGLSNEQKRAALSALRKLKGD